MLQDKSCTLADLLTTFEHIDDFSFDIPTAKKDMRMKIRPICLGDEIMISWITSNSKGFCPTLRRVPGPTIHKRLICSWFHDCSLLHLSSEDDPRPTRIFSDNDCRTTCLHLRRDSGEDTLTLCKQLGWKVPPICSDTGSTVYRRGKLIPLKHSAFVKENGVLFLQKP